MTTHKRRSFAAAFGLFVTFGIIGSATHCTDERDNYTPQSSPPRKEPSAAEKYAMSLRQTYEEEGFNVEVLYFDDEKTLMLRSDEFKDATAREALAHKLWGNRKQLCGTDIWYVKVGYSNGTFSGDTMKSISLGCPAEKAARTKENEAERANYAASLNVDPSVHASANGRSLVFDSDEFFQTPTCAAPSHSAF